MRVFFAYPFTDIINEDTGLVEYSSKDILLKSIDRLKKEGHSVFSAHMREDWGAQLFSPRLATQEDLKEMVNCDVMVAFPGYSPISGGVHVELGWASALNKPIILCIKEAYNYSPLVVGLESITSTETIFYNELKVEEIMPQILLKINKYEQLVS